MVGVGVEFGDCVIVVFGEDFFYVGVYLYDFVCC